MERSKLKPGGDLPPGGGEPLPAGSVVLQRQQSQGYAAALQEQTLAYLSSRGIAVAAEAIPWESGLSTEIQDLPAQLLDPGDLPAEGLPAACEIQPALEAPALLMDFALGAEEAGLTPLTIQAIGRGTSTAGGRPGGAHPHVGAHHRPGDLPAQRGGGDPPCRG